MSHSFEVLEVSLDDLVARIPSDCTLAVPPDYSGVAIAATRALVRRGCDGLHLLACPSSGLQTDIIALVSYHSMRRQRCSRIATTPVSLRFAPATDAMPHGLPMQD